MKPKRPILFVHSGHELYGADKMLILNIRAAKEKYPDKKIVVILPKNGSLSETLFNEFGIEVLVRRIGVLRKYDIKRFNFSFLERVLTFFRLIQYLNKFDLVFINTIVIVDYIIAAHFIKSKVIVHVHELPVGMASIVFTKLLNFSKAELIFVSKASQASFQELKNIKQTVIWNGVKQISSSGLKKNISGKINILFIGRLNSWKGQSLLVKAISLLMNETIEKISVRIVGDVYSNQHRIKESLDRQIENLSLHNTIKILPFTNHPEVHYNWTNIVVVPSLLPEPFGLVAIEAMSIGKIVIAANHGGLTEIVKNNITGLVFDPCNAKDLADKITFAVNNTILLEELSKNAFSEYTRKFTEEICIKNLKKILTSLLQTD